MESSLSPSRDSFDKFAEASLSSEVEHPYGKRFIFVIVMMIFVITSIILYYYLVRSERNALNEGSEIDVIATNQIDGNSNVAAIKQHSVIKMTGYFTAESISDVSSTVIARVDRVLVAPGDLIVEGQVVANLQPYGGSHELAAREALFESAKSNVDRAQLQLNKSKSHLDRVDALHKMKSVSQQTLEDAQSAYDISLVNVRIADSDSIRAKNDLAAHREYLSQYQIRAPFDARVISVNARRGDVISPSSYGGYIKSGILTVVDPKTVGVEIEVQEKLLPLVKSASCVKITSVAEPKVFSEILFHIHEVEMTADRSKSTVKVLLFPSLDMGTFPIIGSSAEVVFHESGSGC